MKRIIIVIVAIIILMELFTVYKNEYYVIPNKSIRIRIIANSNSIEDQILKYKVKENLEKIIYKDLKESKTLDESRRIINENINKYDKAINKSIKENNKDISYKIDYGMHYFPEKKYKGILYKKGNYESLVVQLGKGKGNNWWCILFPPLCLLDKEKNKEKNDIEYRLYIKEIFDNYLK